MRGYLKVALVIAMTTGVAGASEAAGWKKLCNGHDLDGWEKVNTGGTWIVENGIIIARRAPPDRGASWLVTKKDYGDFILRLKYKSAYEKYNSGVLVRDPAHAKLNRPAFSGFEIIIAQGQKDENTNAAIYYVSNAYPQPLHANEWADFEITAIGDHIITYMNGKKMAETHSRRSYKGGIGLHLHGGDEPAENWWKDIEIKELPPAPRPFQLDEERMEQQTAEPVTALAAATADRDFTHYGDSNVKWSAENDELRATGGAEPAWTILNKPYENFVLTFEFKADGNGGGGTVFRVPANAQTDFARRGYEVALDPDNTLNPPGSIFDTERAFVLDPNLQRVFKVGQWNRVRIYATGDHLISYVNLVKTAEVHVKRSASGRIGFQVNPGGTVQFRNIVIRPVYGPSKQHAAKVGSREAHGRG